MPAELTWEAKGVYVSMSGDVLFDDIRMANLRFHTDPRSEEAEYILFDTRGASSFQLSDNDVRYFASLDVTAGEEFNAELKFAILNSDPKMLPSLKLYAEHMKTREAKWSVRFFTEKTSACDWCHCS